MFAPELFCAISEPDDIPSSMTILSAHCGGSRLIQTEWLAASDVSGSRYF